MTCVHWASSPEWPISVPNYIIETERLNGAAAPMLHASRNVFPQNIFVSNHKNPSLRLRRNRRPVVTHCWLVRQDSPKWNCAVSAWVYILYFFFFNKENVYIGIWRVKNWYVSWTRSTWAAGTRAALRRRTARRWRWAAAESWSGSSWSGGEWPSPGPPRIPGGRSEAWWAPAWRSRCSNAARKKDQSACRVNSIQMLTFLGHLFG